MVRIGVLALSLTAMLGAASASASPSLHKYVWSAPHTIVSKGGYDPAVAVGHTGKTVVVFDLYDQSSTSYLLEAAVRKPSGKIHLYTLGKSEGPYAQPSVAAGGDGTFAVAWEHPGVTNPNLDTVEVRVWRPGKHFFGAGRFISSDFVSTCHGCGDYPQAAVDDKGNVYVIWEEYYTDSNGTFFDVVESHQKKGSTAWSMPVGVAPGDVEVHGARLAADGNGYEAVMWNQSGLGGGATAVEASVKKPSQSKLGAEKQLSASTFQQTPSSVGVSDKGKTAFVWDQYESASDYRVEARLAMGDAFATDAVFLTGDNPVKAGWHGAAVSSSGAGLAAWLNCQPGACEVQASFLPAASSSWGAPKDLGPTDSPALSAPAVAIDNQLALIAWVKSAGGSYSLVARVRPNTGQPGATQSFTGVSGHPVIATPNDSLSTNKVLGAMVWQQTTGIQLSVLRH